MAASLVDRYGKADIAGAGADRGIDADDLAGGVDERSTAVAEVDRGVGLDVVVEARVEQLPADEAHDPDGDRVHVTQRVADRAHPFADAEVVRVPERRVGQIPSPGNTKQGDVDRRVSADHLTAVRASVCQRHGDPLGGVNHMEIREDEPVSVDQEAAAGALARSFEVPLTVGVVRRTPRPLLLADRSRRGGVHVHDGRVDALRNVGEVDDRGTGKPGGLRTANRPAVRESPRRSRHDAAPA